MTLPRRPLQVVLSALLIASVALLFTFDRRSHAQGPSLSLPVDCEIGEQCFVQNHVDMAAGPEARDYTCGPLAYDGDRGLDIRVPTLVEMEQGVAVLAGAAGTVKAVRDGEPDGFLDEKGAEAIRGREAGNGVVIDHGGGWETQYSHLRRGSVQVRPGQEVQAGTQLGLIGLSGRTEFPHLEFALRHKGQTIDPFTGLPGQSGCGSGGRGLWTAAAAEALAYRPGGLLAAGFTDRGPETREVLRGDHSERPLGSAAPALVFWALSYGLRRGDREEMRLIGPDGTTLAETVEEVPADKAQWLRFAGLRRPTGGWPAGRYRGDYRLLRAGETLVEVEREIELR